jgi:hypothetical protein
MTDMNELPEVSSNQTQFSTEEPLFENASLPSSSQKIAPETSSPKKPNPLFFLVVGLLFFIIVLLLIVLLLPQKNLPKLMVQPTPSPVSTAKQTELQQRVNEINTDLKNADPTKVDLLFPPVDMSLNLDPPQR